MSIAGLRRIREQFINCFGDYGYRNEPPVKISSNVDPSTTYIGSGISTLKKYILSEIPRQGVIVDQPSMRFRELKKLFDSSYRSHYGAFFNNISLLTPNHDIEALCEQLHVYFTQYLEVSEEDLMVRVRSKDEELYEAAQGQFANLEADTRPDSYYRHTIGIDGYKGINFNIAIKNKSSGEFEDTGNLLSFEKDGEHKFLEIGLGDTVIHKPVMGYDHVLDCYQVKAPRALNRVQQLNYANSVIVSTVLFREGVKASNKNTQTQILRKYVKYLSMVKQQGLATYDDIGNSIAQFEQEYFGDNQTIKENIIATLSEKEETFKASLTSAGLLTL